MQQMLGSANKHQILRNNTELDAMEKPVEAFCTKEALSQFGLQPIPVEKIGPKTNK